MHAWKRLALVLAGAFALFSVLALGQSLSIYYRSSQFDNYLLVVYKHELKFHVIGAGLTQVAAGQRQFTSNIQ